MTSAIIKELEKEIIQIFRRCDVGFKHAGNAWAQLQFREIRNSLVDLRDSQVSAIKKARDEIEKEITEDMNASGFRILLKRHL